MLLSKTVFIADIRGIVTDFLLYVIVFCKRVYCTGNSRLGNDLGQKVLHNSEIWRIKCS